jgi:hypothetical protein
MTTPTEPIVIPSVAPPLSTPAPPTEQYFTAAQVEAARQQEKDKVYDRITRAEDQSNIFKTELATLRADKDARDAEAARAQAEAEKAVKDAAEEKLTATQLIAAREKEMQDRFAAMEAKLAADQAVIAKEQQFLSLQSYTQRRVAEEQAQDNIAPEFLDYITGETAEQIEASITKAVEKTASIAEARANAGALTPRLPGVSPTGFAPAGPLDQFQHPHEYTQAEIDAMSMPEYAEYRKIKGIDKAGKDRGMFS